MGTVFNESRTYGVELEVNTNRRAQTLVDAINAKFTARNLDTMQGAWCYLPNSGGMHYTHENSSGQWKVVSDATVRGWEVVSPILSGFSGREEIKAVCEALQELGCTVGIQTGMHVHHNARGLTAKQFGGIFGTYAAFQTLLNYGVSQSRRGRQFGGYNGIADWSRITQNGTDNYDSGYSVTGVSGTTAFQGPNDRAFISTMNSKIGMSRNCSISIGSSLSRHGTIEFRQHQGTINATKIWTWVLLTQAIVERHVQNRVRFPKPLHREMAEGKAHPKGDYYRFKSFIGVTADMNNHDTGASAPYMWAFRQLYKNIKKFARVDGITDTKLIGR